MRIVKVLGAPIVDDYRRGGWGGGRRCRGCSCGWRRGRLNHRYVIGVLSGDIVGRHPASLITRSREIYLPPAAISAHSHDFGALSGTQHAQNRVAYPRTASNVQVGGGGCHRRPRLWGKCRGWRYHLGGRGGGFEGHHHRRCWFRHAEERLGGCASLSNLRHNRRQPLSFPAASRRNRKTGRKPP